jgi:hypothetical protein
MRASLLLALALLALPLAACEDMTKTTSAPDLTIKLAPSADGKRMIAVPPECANWRTDELGTFENQPMPQFGCASARNLAAMIEKPEDLVQGRDLAPADGTVTAAGEQLYRQGKTVQLVNPSQKDAQAATTSRSGTAAAQ